MKLLLKKIAMNRLRSSPILFVFVLLFLPMLFSPQEAHAVGPNLILNAGLETSGVNGLPENWKKGGYGSNSRVLSYPVAGNGSSKAIRTEITSYTSGDAKWYFTNTPVDEATTYIFSDAYRSNAINFVTVEFTLANGTKKYLDLGGLSPSSNWDTFTTSFLTPEDTVSVTIFHLIKSVGFVETDDYSLREATGSQTVIPNAGLETSGVNGLPESWRKGGFGNNTRVLSYPVSGYNSAKAVRTQITSYTSGDAKWYFPSIPVDEETAYEFSDVYRSDTTSHVTVEFTLANGSTKYLDLGSLSPADDWEPFASAFTTPAGTVSVSVFHLIKSVGFVETDNYNLREVSGDPTKFESGLVSIQFDDGWLAAYENAYPILEAANFDTDAFIIAERLSENDFPGFMKADEVLEIQSDGHEIGAHTVTHADLTKLSESEARREIVESKQALLDINAAPVHYFAYPFGAYNEEIKQMVKDAGFLGARSSNDGYNLKTEDRFALRRQPMINTTTFADIKEYIDTALAERTWVILLFHQVDNSGHGFAVTPELFEQTVEYLELKNVTPVTLSEGINLMDQ